MNKLFVLVCVFLVSLGGFVFYQNSLKAVSVNLPAKTFTIEAGQSLDEISRNLKEQGLVRNRVSFKFYVWSAGLASKLQAGDYQISPAEDAKTIARKLTTGFSDVWVTIPEGWRVEEIAQKLASVLPINQDEFIQNAKEGYMFPDTYRLPRKVKAAEIAKIMLDNFNRRLDDNLKEQINQSGLSLEEVVILASIVEREVRFAQDRPVVAGILIKRLQIGMRLEADATVQYALGYDPVQKTYWKKSLTADDLKVDSAYNTRKYAGLPPTPICNPGLASIQAVIAPLKTDYLYYLSDQSGKMHYAKTLDEHLANIAQYL